MERLAWKHSGVHWTNKAINDLLAIYEHVRIGSLEYADRVADRLTRRSEQAAQFPMSGRVVPEYEREDIRELIETPYRILYRVLDDQIDVLSVVHSRQRLPPQV